MSMYITVKEFKNAPTGIDTMNIIPGGTTAQNDAELYNIIQRASAWIDDYCQMDALEATVNTEVKEVTMNNEGLIRVHPNNIPIVQLQDSVQYRITPAGGWIPLSLDFIQALERYFVIYNLNATAVSPVLAQQLPSFGYFTPYKIKGLQKLPITVKYSYVNGYTNTLLDAAVTAGSKLIVLKDATGTYQGQNLTIYEDDKTERVRVDSVNGDVVTTVKPLKYDHSVDVGVSALPASVKQAAILLASYFIKERGGLAVTMGETSMQGVNRYKDAADIDVAQDLLKHYKRGVVS